MFIFISLRIVSDYLSYFHILTKKEGGWGVVILINSATGACADLCGSKPPTSESVTSGIKTTLISMSWAEKLKSREFVELAILYGLVLITEWTVHPVNQILFWVTLAWVVATTIRARQSARDLGLRPANLRQSVWVAAAALAFAAVGLWIAAERQ